MTEELKQKIKDEMQSLPRELQVVIDISGWEKISEEICKKYYFSEEEISKIQAEIAIILVGAEFADELATNIENEAGTSKNEAEKIVEEVEQKIFIPIMKSLETRIKGTMPTRMINWQQNLDFILSGGDYVAFIRQPLKEEKEDTTPKTNTTFNHSKVDDLKSRFTI